MPQRANEADLRFLARTSLPLGPPESARRLCSLLQMGQWPAWKADPAAACGSDCSNSGNLMNLVQAELRGGATSLIWFKQPIRCDLKMAFYCIYTFRMLENAESASSRRERNFRFCNRLLISRMCSSSRVRFRIRPNIR